jgi:hypothetical protein
MAFAAWMMSLAVAERAMVRTRAWLLSSKTLWALAGVSFEIAE